jgi:tryptophan halogenase
MKIAVIGAGTVGVMSVLHFLKYIPNSEVTCIYSPDKKILGIGESSTIVLPELLWNSVEYNVFIDSNELSSTVKLGVCYKNWRKKDFISPILPTKYAMHFDNFSLSEKIFNRAKKIYGKNFIILNKNVKELKQNDKEVTVFFDKDKKIYDYVIDCRGYPEDYSDYHMCTSLPLNRAFVNLIPEPGHWNYTYHYAHKNGWMFGIPLTNRQGWGYLFNDQITSEQEAIDEINEIFKSNKSKKDLRDFKFKPFRSKSFLNNRIIKNGNRAIFYEPLEALSGSFYDSINRFFYDYINKNMEHETVNILLEERAKQYENFIAWVYNQGSIYNTKFWKYTNKITSKHFKNNSTWNITKEYLKKNKKEYKENIYKTWPFNRIAWEILFKGFNTIL